MFYICIYIYTTALYEHLFKRYMYTFFLFVFSSAKEFGFLPVFVCELVCQQDDTKPAQHKSMKLYLINRDCWALRKVCAQLCATLIC